MGWLLALYEACLGSVNLRTREQCANLLKTTI